MIPAMSSELRVARVESLRVEHITPARRAALSPALTAIVRERFDVERPEVIADYVVFRQPPATLDLLYNHRDQLIGFIASNLQEITVEGHQYTIFDAGMYVRAGVRGLGWLTYQRAISEPLRYKLRHRKRRVVFVSAMLTPISYHRGCGWPGLHPHADRKTPAQVEAVVRHAAHARGYQVVGNDPWQVNIGFRVTPRDPERLQRAIAAARDRHIEHYLQLNPSYLEGDWLMTYAPLDLKTIAQAICWSLPRQLLQAAKQRLGKR